MIDQGSVSTHNQHQTQWGCQKEYKEQNLERVKGVRKRKGKGQEKNWIKPAKKETKQNKSNFWLTPMLQSKTLHILVPYPQGNLAPW